MQSNKVVFVFFGIIAMVMAASLSSKVKEQDDDVISDRRFRWEFSQDSDESANDLQEDDDDDVENDDDQDDSGSGSEEIWIIEYPEGYESASDESASNESASNESASNES
ncbi:rRNA-processing protein EFG1 [Drosophila santomea]|uniref:rRNA-processing protein EFG1 n=1 Tax=Drosophila santomea TaxID=129105 RepID=UPI0019539843|nr:rRNA-processing protein EFG1 [Drosophila santomea]